MSARAITWTALLLTCCTIGSLQATPRFGPGPSPVAGQWQVNGAELCAVAEETRRYLERGPEYDPAAIHGGVLVTSATTHTRGCCSSARMRRYPDVPGSRTGRAYVELTGFSTR